jgi:hypothetical protein
MVSPHFGGMPSRVVVLVSMQPTGDLTEKEFHNWYEEEHTPLFNRIPGWRRTRRAKLIDADERF